MLKPFNNVKKNIEALDRQFRDLENMREIQMSRCVHLDKNQDLNVVRKRNPGPNESLYACKICKKDLVFTKITESEMAMAVSIIDRAIDIIKISLNLSDEKDVKILKRYSKVQYRVRTQLSKLLWAAYSKNRKGGQNNGDRRNNGGGMWGRATVNGR